MTAAPNFAYALLAKRLRRQAKPGEFDLSTLRFALSGAEPVEPADVEDLLEAGKPFGLRPDAILPAYGMAETTLAVSFSDAAPDWWSTRSTPTCSPHCAARCRQARATCADWRPSARCCRILRPASSTRTATYCRSRGVGVIELRGESLTPGDLTMGGFVAAQDENGWYDPATWAT